MELRPESCRNAAQDIQMQGRFGGRQVPNKGDRCETLRSAKRGPSAGRCSPTSQCILLLCGKLVAQAARVASTAVMLASSVTNRRRIA